VTSGLDRLRRYLGGLTVYLRNYGASLPEPALDRYLQGGVGFEFEALLPGSDRPRPATVHAGEIWEPVDEGYVRAEYVYELIDYPLDRRRALHSHDTDIFARRFGVLVHEHCEEVLGQPTCGHYHGIPVENGYEALDRLLVTWARPEPLGCTSLRCIG
jgi:hypothetical protein